MRLPWLEPDAEAELMAATDDAKIIIHVRDGVDRQKAVAHVGLVMWSGLISADGQSYCYHTEFKDGIAVSTDKPRQGSATYTFYVYRSTLPKRSDAAPT